MSYYKGKKILVIGGTGLIGMPLVHKLLKQEAKLTVVSLDENIDLDKSIEFKKLDLRDFNNCLKVTKNKDIVFNLAGVKGSPKMTKEKPIINAKTKCATRCRISRNILWNMHEPMPKPNATSIRRPKNVFSYNYKDFMFIDYNHHPTLKGSVAI